MAFSTGYRCGLKSGLGVNVNGIVLLLPTKMHRIALFPGIVCFYIEPVEASTWLWWRPEH